MWIPWNNCRMEPQFFLKLQTDMQMIFYFKFSHSTVRIFWLYPCPNSTPIILSTMTDRYPSMLDVSILIIAWACMYIRLYDDETFFFNVQCFATCPQKPEKQEECSIYVEERGPEAVS